MLLYDNQSSGNCYKVRLLLAQLGIPYDVQEVSVLERGERRENRRGLLGDRNPALRVPVLELDDGRCLPESNAILWYLADGTDYLPGNPFERAQVLQWQFFEQYSHEPYIAVARYLTTILGEPERYAAELEAKRAEGYVTLDAMERHLADRVFLVAERYTIADIALYAYTHVADTGGFDLAGYPAIRTWLERVAAQPGHVTLEG